MKNVLSVLICSLFLPVICQAGFYSNGPNVDYTGKPVVKEGKTLFRQFAEASPFMFEKGKPNINHWDWFCFEANSRPLIDWEIEKALKIKLYKLSNFNRDAPTLKSDEILSLLFLDSARSEEVLNVLGNCIVHPGKEFPQEDIIKFMAALSVGGPEGQSLYKRCVEQQKNPEGYKAQIKYQLDFLKRTYPFHPQVNAQEMRQQVFDLRIKNFRNSKGNQVDNIEKYWMLYWDRLYVLNKLLDEKAVNDKNYITYCLLVFNSGMIQDDLARKIIAYFKLNNDSRTPLNYFVAYFLGVNPLLTKAVVKSFARIKPAKCRDVYSGMAMYIKNDPNLMRDAPNDGLHARPTLNPWLIYGYANACGDYNKGWKFYQEIKRQVLSEYEISRKFVADKCDENTFALLCGHSNLDLKTASHILQVITESPGGWKLRPNVKFAKLVDGHDDISFRVAKFFPFESLSPQMQEKLFIYYLKKVEEKGRENCEYFENLLQITSQKYRDKLVRQLLKQHVYGHVNNTACGYALQRLAPFVLPELVKISGEDDSKMAKRSCELIGAMSLYGKPAAKGLEQVLQTSKRFTIKIAVILALARIGSRESIPVIETYVGAKNKLIDRAARQAVRLLKPVTTEEFVSKE